MELIIIAFALGLDAFSLCLGIGIGGTTAKQRYLLSTIVGVFHIIMPLIGLLAGAGLGKVIGPIAGKIGATVLVVIGGNTLWKWYKGKRESVKSGMENVENDVSPVEVATTMGMMIMAFSVSLDALTVGVGLGASQFDILLAVGIFGIVAAVMTYLGLVLGKKIGSALEGQTEWIAGVILILVGLRLFL